jgi:hypothetical protein
LLVPLRDVADQGLALLAGGVTLRAKTIRYGYKESGEIPVASTQ